MEKIHKYTTTNGLITKTTQFNLNNFITGRFNHINNGWVRFKVSPKVKKQIERLFNRVVGEVDLNISKTCGLFDRLIIEKEGRGFTCKYIAGQDYQSEIKYLKKLIKDA